MTRVRVSWASDRPTGAGRAVAPFLLPWSARSCRSGASVRRAETPRRPSSGRTRPFSADRLVRAAVEPCRRPFSMLRHVADDGDERYVSSALGRTLDTRTAAALHGGHGRRDQSILARAPTVPRVPGRPSEPREDVPELHDNGSVVSQLRAESPLARLGDMPRTEEVRSSVILGGLAGRSLAAGDVRRRFCVGWVELLDERPIGRPANVD